MNAFFEPNPILLTYLALKTTFYLPVVLLLSLLRAIIAKGPARAFALLAAVIALAGIIARFGPPLLGMSGGPVAQFAYAVANAGGGMAMALAASVPLAISAFAPGRRWPVLDALHGLLVSALFVLWLLAQ
ncbi:MAG: hypothetical protein ACNA7O_13415 [Rhodobacterales bacterium]